MRVTCVENAALVARQILRFSRVGLKPVGPIVTNLARHWCFLLLAVQVHTTTNLQILQRTALDPAPPKVGHAFNTPLEQLFAKSGVTRQTFLIVKNISYPGVT